MLALDLGDDPGYGVVDRMLHDDLFNVLVEGDEKSILWQ